MKQQQPPQRSAPIIATLMPRSHYGISKGMTLDPVQWNEILAGARTLYVIGTVTYLDRMDRKRHRHFYGRRFVAGLKGNNLVFVDDPPYNYEEDLDGAQS